MRFYSNIVDTDRGYADLVRRIGEADLYVDVGVFQEGSAKYSDGTTVAQVALWQEFGTYKSDGSPHIPPRPFIRLYFDGESGHVFELARAAMMQVVLGSFTKKRAMARLGMQMVAEIRLRIKSGYGGAYPPNAPVTIARKGSATPLVDTGQLWSAISYRVRIQGGSK